MREGGFRAANLLSGGDESGRIHRRAKGEFDWIVKDPDIDFAAMFSKFDTFLIGRRTFEMMAKHGNTAMPGKVIVFSRTLKQQDHPEVTIVASKLEKTVASLREKPGKDMWLFGGGSLFRSFLDAKLVDRVEVGVIPVFLGGGIPCFPLQPHKPS